MTAKSITKITKITHHTVTHTIITYHNVTFVCAINCQNGPLDKFIARLPLFPKIARESTHKVCLQYATLGFVLIHVYRGKSASILISTSISSIQSKGLLQLGDLHEQGG